MSEDSTLENIAEIALRQATHLGCNDISIICSRSNDSQVRFASNAITLVNNVRNLTLDAYLGKDKKRIVGTTYNPTESGLKQFIGHLVKSCESLPPNPDYATLPHGPFQYTGISNFDPKVAESNLVDYVKQSIDRALTEGAKRVSGSLNTENGEIYLVTSSGASGHDKYSQILLNVRAFSEDNASGHGLSCSSHISEFNSEEAGERAGIYSKMAIEPKSVSEGVYDVVFTPTVVANILPVASNASSFEIDMGNSFLIDKLDKKVAIDTLNVSDYGVYERGLGGRIFDDEGMPTGRNEIISDGYFRTILHNSTTAKKAGKSSTGNAGIIIPRPFTVVFGNGDSSLEEMIKETKHGLLITNNWYTRYQNMRAGEYSTVPRDAAFKIVNGEIAEPVVGLRVSDSIPRQLENIDLTSKKREWIKWWEVNTPTLAPAMRIKGVSITKAVGS